MRSVLMVHDPEPEVVIPDPWIPHTWTQAGIAAVLLSLTVAYFLLCWGGA